jgi:hypothetical protein
MRTWKTHLGLLAMPLMLAACGADDADPTSQEALSGAQDAGAGALDSGAPEAAHLAPSRFELSALPLDERTRLYAAIVDFVRSAPIRVKVFEDHVVHWEDPTFDYMRDVSVVRGHYAIHHHGSLFFVHHRDYLASLESYLSTLHLPHLPQGRLPFWLPSTPIPAPFAGVPTPQVDCYTGGALTNACDWQYGALLTSNPNIPIPARYSLGSICSFPTLDALADDICPTDGGLHNDVHNALGGTMKVLDAPAAPIFWVFHATLDDIYQRWLDCSSHG